MNAPGPAGSAGTCRCACRHSPFTRARVPAGWAVPADYPFSMDCPIVTVPSGLRKLHRPPAHQNIPKIARPRDLLTAATRGTITTWMQARSALSVATGRRARAGAWQTAGPCYPETGPGVPAGRRPGQAKRQTRPGSTAGLPGRTPGANCRPAAISTARTAGCTSASGCWSWPKIRTCRCWNGAVRRDLRERARRVLHGPDGGPDPPDGHWPAGGERHLDAPPSQILENALEMARDLSTRHAAASATRSCRPSRRRGSRSCAGRSCCRRSRQAWRGSSGSASTRC